MQEKFTLGVWEEAPTSQKNIEESKILWFRTGFVPGEPPGSYAWGIAYVDSSHHATLAARQRRFADGDIAARWFATADVDVVPIFISYRSPHLCV